MEAIVRDITLAYHCGDRAALGRCRAMACKLRGCVLRLCQLTHCTMHALRRAWRAHACVPRVHAPVGCWLGR